MPGTPVSMEDFQHMLYDENDPNPFAAQTPEFVTFRQLLRGQSGWMRSEDFFWILYQNKKSLFFYRPAKVSLTPTEGFNVEVRNVGLACAMFPDRETFLARMNADDAQQFPDTLAEKGGICDMPIIYFRDES